MDDLACALYVTVTYAKSVGDCGSNVGFKWSQLETFMVYIIVSSSSSSGSSNSS